MFAAVSQRTLGKFHAREQSGNSGWGGTQGAQ